MNRNTAGRLSTTQEVRTQSAILDGLGSPYITSSALYDNLQFTLPDATVYTNGWYVITHQGPRCTTVVDATGFRFDFDTPGQVVYFEVVNDGWAVTGADEPCDCRVWDPVNFKFRQATSMQDIVDSLHAQIRGLTGLVRLLGAQLTDEQEDFYGRT